MAIAIIVILLIIVFASIRSFGKDMNAKSNELAQVGGIKRKYKILLDDLHEVGPDIMPMTVFSDKPNDYTFGWTGTLLLMKFWLSEVHNFLHITYTVRLIHMDDDMRVSNGKLEWKFETTKDQNEMNQIIAKDLEAYLETL